MDIKQKLIESRLEAEALLKALYKVEAYIGKRGYKTALKELRQQSMCSRKNLKDLRMVILEEVKGV